VKTTDETAQMATALNAAVDGLREALGSISQGSEQRSIEDVSGAVRVAAQGASEMQEAAGEVSRTADELRRLVAGFRY
jgi:methyl-accepting chemotaxis protein